MPTLFQKLGREGRNLFQKLGGNDANFGRKVGNTARKFDNTIQRVGNFLSSSANDLGLGSVASGIDRVVGNEHQIRNNLEKSIHTPMSNINQHYV